MAKQQSMYARLASRFAHLALGAKEEEDEEDKEASTSAAEDDEDEDDGEEEASDGKKGKRAKKDCPDTDAAEDDDDDEDEKDEKERKAKASATAAERDRWCIVMSSPEARGRVPLACSLLADTDMTAEKVCAALRNSPAELPVRVKGLAARMAEVPRPDVGSGAGASAAAAAAAGTPQARAAEIVAAYKKAGGGR